MTKLILVDLDDGRMIAGLVTSLIFNWKRLPIGLQTAIICHASETAFAHADSALQADEQIVRFIKTQHQVMRRAPSDHRLSLRRAWTRFIRRRRLIRVMNRPMPLSPW